MLGLPTIRSLFRHLCFRRLRDLSWTRSQKIMQNEAGDYVDMYTPRKCSVTNRVIAAKDHASVQLNVGEIDETGRFTGNFKTYALCGSIRQMGEADDALTRLCIEDGIVNKNYNS